MPFITQGKTNLKYILIVIILAVIVGGGILGYYNWRIAKHEARLTEFPEIKFPKKIKDETADLSAEALAKEDWKSYRNEKYGYEVKYPPGYVILYPENIENIVFTNEEQLQIVREKQMGEFTAFVVRINRNDKKLEPQEWLDENLSVYLGLPSNKDLLIDLVDVSINGIKGLQFTTESMGSPRHTLLAKDDFIIDISGSGVGKIYDQMLSTFRFLE